MKNKKHKILVLQNNFKLNYLVKYNNLKFYK
jgi:hypothetical protein